MKLTKEIIKNLIKEELDNINEASMMMPRARDLFGKTVYWRDLVQVKKVTKTGREKVDFERVVSSGIIEKPSKDSPDGGLPGYRETRSPLLSSDQVVVVTKKDGDRERFKANGQEITLLDLLSDDEVKDLIAAGTIE
ncbi:MAG: hypothetical protein NZ811_02650 [Gammaproteobacteria bacterium]|nr:hypothetical protein [Gammaproteobacteria bacterium]